MLVRFAQIYRNRELHIEYSTGRFLVRWALIAPPNGLRFSRATLIKRGDGRHGLRFQNRQDLRPLCSVGYKRLLDLPLFLTQKLKVP